MKIHRSKHTEHFTILPNAALRDERLSYRARGVLMELLSRPEDWQTTADALARTAKQQRGKKGEGRDAMRGAFAELKAAGYLVVSKGKGEGGTHTTELHVYDVAQDVTSDDAQKPRSDRGTGNQSSENQASADQSSENQASLERTGDGRTDTKDSSTKDYSSSSVSSEAEPPQGEAPEKKTKRDSPEQIIIDKLTSEGAQPQGGPPTPDEAAAVKRLVISQAATDGVRVHTPAGYLSGRDVVLLEQDLAAVRGLQPPAQASTGGSYWENQMRGERNARNGHRGGTRYGVESQETYEALAAMSDQEAIDHMFFGGKPAKPALVDSEFSGDF